MMKEKSRFCLYELGSIKNKILITFLENLLEHEGNHQAYIYPRPLYSPRFDLNSVNASPLAPRIAKIIR